MTDPEILRMERYGEPRRWQKEDARCEVCEQPMWAGEDLILADGKWMCEDCFKAWAEDNFNVMEMAKMMGFETRCV